MENFHAETFPEPGLEKSRNIRRTIFDLFETILLSAVLFLGINAVSARIRVDSFSMEPTLNKGDFVIVNKVSYKLGSPRQGDIIVFHYPPNPEEQYIKRVIGLAGDQIRIADGEVYINGELLIEPYIQAPTSRGGDWEIPQDSLFVMGDNRNNSSDSRVWGVVPYDYIVGKATVIYWPPDKWNLLSFPYAIAAEP